MFIICLDVSHSPTAKARDLFVLILAPVASLYTCNVSWSFCTSAGVVNSTVTSSAYATLTVFVLPRPILTPASFSSSMWRSGLRQSVYSCMLRGQPCRIELRTGMGVDLKPLTWTSDAAFLSGPWCDPRINFPNHELAVCPVGNCVKFCQKRNGSQVRLHIMILSLIPLMLLHPVLSRLRQRRWSPGFRNTAVEALSPVIMVSIC